MFLAMAMVPVLFVWVIDQARGQDGWILAKFFFCVFMDRDEVEVHKLAKKERVLFLFLAKFFFCVFMDRDEVEVHKLAKKERGQYPAILTEQAWSIKDLLYDLKHQNNDL